MTLTVLILSILLLLSDLTIFVAVIYFFISKKKDDDAKKAISDHVKSESISDLVRDANESADHDDHLPPAS